MRHTPTDTNRPPVRQAPKTGTEADRQKVDEQTQMIYRVWRGV